MTKMVSNLHQVTLGAAGRKPYSPRTYCVTTRYKRPVLIGIKSETRRAEPFPTRLVNVSQLLLNERGVHCCPV